MIERITIGILLLLLIFTWIEYSKRVRELMVMNRWVLMQDDLLCKARLRNDRT